MPVFPKTKSSTIVGVGAVRINLGDIPATATAPAFRKITYHLELVDADGVMVRTQGGDLTPFLTAAQLNALNSFIDAMRAKAVETMP